MYVLLMVKGWILLEKQIVNLEPSHYKQLFFFNFLFFVCNMRDLHSLSKDRTNAPCTGITESLPLDH